ncbi:MAG TPA: TonB-dependent receptor, partial [Polyangiales bacterium]|nr:TonB-dependent receptor [Polyangiales bacterium]
IGGNARYEQDFGGGLQASVVAGYAYNQSDWIDKSRCVFDWFGQCVFERATAGELGRAPSDRSLWSHTGYARSNLSWVAHPDHIVRLSVSPTYFTRTGEERAIGEAVLDRMGGLRQLLSWINGVEYETTQLSTRLINVAFFKHYHQGAYAKQPVAGDYELNLDTKRNLFGAGDGIRFSITHLLLAKASYEYAIRLPEPDEVFGNGAAIVENLELHPERSHNANVSLLLQRLETSFGTFDSSITGFFRRAEDLVVLLGAEGLFQYRNVGEARILGVEGMLSWLSPGKHLELSLNSTYQDARNVSPAGAFGTFKGDRMPNRPYFFANASVRLQRRDLVKQGDELSLTWYGRYVHDFFLNWESLGEGQNKSTVEAQLAHTVVLAYALTGAMVERLTFSAEVQNLTDEKVFDFYGVQRPGRAIYFKTNAMF